MPSAVEIWPSDWTLWPSPGGAGTISLQKTICAACTGTPAWCISDRLHVLIFAATEGAVPLYLPNVKSSKIPRTMDVVDLGRYQAQADDREAAVSTAVALAATQQAVLERVSAARSELGRLSGSMNALLTSGAAS